MADWVTITDSQCDPDAPLTSGLAYAWRDNTIAIAEGSPGAPVLSAAWHPYDMVSVGDGTTGLFYDVAVSGATATITTPTFANGWDYRVRWSGASTSGANADFRINGIGLTNMNGTANCSGYITIEAARQAGVQKYGLVWNGTSVSGSSALAALGATLADPFFGYLRIGGSGAVSSLAFTWSLGNHDAGQWFLERKRNIATN